MNLEQIIIKPLITEKSMLATAKSKFSFVVNRHATKYKVKKAVESLFKVQVVKINLIKVKGKKKTIGRLTKRLRKKPDWKKAIVQLAKGQKIDLFDIQGEKK